MTKLLTKEDIRQILAARFKDDCHTKLSSLPSPLVFKNIEKSALRIKQAYENDEVVGIVGDYDADGVVASVVLSQFFDKVGIRYKLYIPNRFKDGYGLNPNIVRTLDTNLIVTVDNGITANEAADICKQKKIDLIITDHHSVPEILPDAYAIVNPKQTDCEFPCKEICGAQVAWYLCAAIKEVCGFDCDLSYWLDILAIAIMADLMELKDINRIMVKKGLSALNKTQRPAFLAIKDMFCKKEFGSDDISFLIAPLINSTGRMKDAMLSVNFLNSKSYDEAYALLEEIVELNNLRKKQESDLFTKSLEMVKGDECIIVVWGEGWHEGVIGIVASRLSRRFKKPAIVFSIDGFKAKGSARSIGGIDILSIIAENSDMLLGFGGHKGAAGVSIEKQNLSLFRQKLEKTCKSVKPCCSSQDILGEIDPRHIDFELLRILKSYEPYGEKNPRPCFLIKQIYVKTTRYLGKDENHLKLILKNKNTTLESLFFNFDKEAIRGDFIDIVFTIGQNDFRGLITPQLVIREIL